MASNPDSIRVWPLLLVKVACGVPLDGDPARPKQDGGGGSDGGESELIPTPPERVDSDGDGYDSAVDCLDTDASVHPGATEVIGNEVDEDCDGLLVSIGDAHWSELVLADTAPIPATMMGLVVCGEEPCLVGLSPILEGDFWPEGFFVGDDPDLQYNWLGWSGSVHPVSNLESESGSILDLRFALGSFIPLRGWISIVDGGGGGFSTLADARGVYELSNPVTEVAAFPPYTAAAPQPSGSPEWDLAEGFWINTHGADLDLPPTLRQYPRSVDGSFDWSMSEASIEFSPDESMECYLFREADVNADGAGDLLCNRAGWIGERFKSPWKVYFGPITAETNLAEPDIVFAEQMSDMIDFVGDFTGDGISEVAFGAFHPDAPHLGQALVVMDLHDKVGEVSVQDAVAVFYAASDHEMMERPQVAAGDFDVDGVRDLIVTAPQIGVGLEEEVLNAPPRGRVSFFRGPIAGTYRPEDADRIWLGPAWDDGFGTGLVVGEDWNGDGQPDLMVGAGFSVWDHSYSGAIWYTTLDLGE